MKRIVLLLVALLAFGQAAIPASAQTPKHTTPHNAPHKPKNEISKLRKDRKTNHTVRQITPDPKKSPGKHANNLSKNINHEINRESKDFNHAFQNNPKKK